MGFPCRGRAPSYYEESGDPVNSPGLCRPCPTDGRHHFYFGRRGTVRIVLLPPQGETSLRGKGKLYFAAVAFVGLAKLQEPRDKLTLLSPIFLSSSLLFSSHLVVSYRFSRLFDSFSLISTRDFVPPPFNEDAPGLFRIERVGPKSFRVLETCPS